MSKPSPYTHLIRLGLLMAVGLCFALAVRALAVPSSWDHHVWYRTDALQELAQQPNLYGGNDSCTACHQALHEEMKAAKHQGLSCEACHGPLSIHIQNGRRAGKAEIDTTPAVCLNCHGLLASRPATFPQTRLVRRHDEIAQDRPMRHKKLTSDARCDRCHGFHDPEP